MLLYSIDIFIDYLIHENKICVPCISVSYYSKSILDNTECIPREQPYL